MNPDIDPPQQNDETTTVRRSPLVLFVGVRLESDRNRTERQQRLLGNALDGELLESLNSSTNQSEDDRRPLIWLPILIPALFNAFRDDGEDDENDSFNQLLNRLFHEFKPKGPPPASTDAIKACPIVKARDDTQSCTVCQYSFSKGEEMMELPCCHSYHPDCITPWLKEHNTCPTCRYELAVDDEQEEAARRERMSTRRLPVHSFSDPNSNSTQQKDNYCEKEHMDEDILSTSCNSQQMFSSSSYGSEASAPYLGHQAFYQEEPCESEDNQNSRNNNDDKWDTEEAHEDEYNGWDAYEGDLFGDDYSPGTYDDEDIDDGDLSMDYD